MRRALLALVLASTLGAGVFARPAQAAGPIAPAAKVVLDEGLALYEARSYAQALAAFRRGYAIDPHPDFLYAMAQAERLAGDCAAASEDYRRFLKADPPEHEASLARENLAKCEALAKSTEPDNGPKASPEAPPAPPVVMAPVIVPPPVVLQPPAGPDVVVPARSFWTDPAAMTLASIALASASAGAVLLSLGEVRAQSAAAAPNVTAFAEELTAARDFRIAGGTLLGAGVLSACLSAITWGVVSSSSPAPSSPTRPAPNVKVTTNVGPGGGFVGLELGL